MGKYIGIDIGTTSLKSADFDSSGKKIGFRRIDYTLNTDSQTGFIEFDAEKYFQMCETVISELVDECGEISALSVDTQGETLILADETGKPLCPVIVWLDNRAVKQAELIKEQFGSKRVYETTGQAEIIASWPAAKLLWIS